MYICFHMPDHFLDGICIPLKNQFMVFVFPLKIDLWYLYSPYFCMEYNSYSPKESVFSQYTPLPNNTYSLKNSISIHIEYSMNGDSVECCIM